MYSIGQCSPSTATSRWLPVKWRHFRVTSGHLRSRDVISCHVIASSCELQPCRKWNVQYMSVFGLLSNFQVTSGQMTSLPGHLRSRDVISCHVTASSCKLSLVGSEISSIRQFSTFYSHFQVTSGQMTSLEDHFLSPEVTWRHFLSRDCLLLQATAL